MNLPFDTEAEMGIIACCLNGGLESTMQAVETVQLEALSSNSAMLAFVVLRKLEKGCFQISTVTFAQKWAEVWGDKPLPADIFASVDKFPSKHDLPTFVESVNDCHARRRAVGMLDTALHAALDRTVKLSDTLAAIETETFAAVNGEGKTHTAHEVSKLLLADLERRFDLNGGLSGVGTGFYKFDHLTSGLQFGEQTIVAASSSAGKTAFCINVVEKACVENLVPTLVISMEMSEVALHRRLFSSRCKFPLREMKEGKVNPEKFTEFLKYLKTVPLFYHDAIGGIESNKLDAVVRRNVRKNGIKLVCIDYLQKIIPAGRHEKRTYEVASVSGQLKALAVSTGCAFLTLAQLNQDPMKQGCRQPTLSDMADSAQIVRDADTVALLWRIIDMTLDGNGIPKDPLGLKSKLIVAKQRDGETGSLDLNFDGEYCRFNNASNIDDADIPNHRPQSSDP